MDIKTETIEVVAEQKPQVFMQSIAFNDGTVLPLASNISFSTSMRKCPFVASTSLVIVMHPC